MRMLLLALFNSENCQVPFFRNKSNTHLEDDDMGVLLGETDGPVRLLLALTTSEAIGVESGYPSTLTRSTRAIEEGKEAVRIVHDGDLQRALKGQRRQ